MDRDEELRRRRGEHTRSYSQDRPDGGGENLQALLRGIKQWLPDIPGSVGDIADLAYEGGAKALTGKRVVKPLGAGAAIRRAITRPTSRAQTELSDPNTSTIEEVARLLNPFMLSPKTLAKMGALSLVGSANGIGMSAVLPNGLTKSNMLHNLAGGLGEIRALLNSKIMHSPSIAIAELTPYPFAETPTLVLNPKSARFDPRLNRANQLYNRDAYTFRNRDISELPYALQEGISEARFTEDAYPKTKYWSEEDSLPANTAHTLAIGASPRFNSLSEWENSPLGYGVLGEFGRQEQIMANNLARRATDYFEDIGIDEPNSKAAIKALKNRAQRGDYEARRILDAFSKVPSSYAELKVLGEMPINADNVSALLLPARYDKNELAELAKAYQQSSIPFGHAEELASTATMLDLENKLSHITDYVKAAKNPQQLQSLPAELQGYLSSNWINSILANPNSIEAITAKAFKESPRYEADIVHSLTIGN